MDVQEFDNALTDLETRVDRLRALYENWFRGYEKAEPGVARKDVERRVYGLRKELPRNTALRFRYHQLYQRYTTLASYWQRTARQVEEGTYRMQLQRLRRRKDEVGVRLARPELDELATLPPKSFELNLDETLDVGQLLDAAELDQVASAIDAPVPQMAVGQARAESRAMGRFARPDGKAPARPSLTLESLESFGGLPAILVDKPENDVVRGGERAKPSSAEQASALGRGTPASAGAEANTLPPRAGQNPPPAPSAKPSLVANTLPPVPRTGHNPPLKPSLAANTLPPVPRTGQMPLPPAPPAKPSLAANTLPPVPRTGQVPLPPAPSAKPSLAANTLPPVPRSGQSPAQPGPARVAPRVPAPPASASSALSDQQLRRIYDDYVSARRKNNEGDVRFETLASSIHKMLPDLQKRHQGKRIDFEIVVKDGRVGLKPKAV